MSILMKRILKVTFWVVFIAFDIVALMSLSNAIKKGQYTINTENLETVIEYGEDISFDDIVIVDNRLFGLVETRLTEDMIVSIDDTSTAGQKRIVFNHNNKQYTVTVTVKYKVEFLAYGKIIDTQMVVTPDELNIPTPVAEPGYEFSHWDYDISGGFTDNVQINAVFVETAYPALVTLRGTYGDTLADFTLPSNENGRWEFLDPGETPVGNAGKNFHSVRFVYNDHKDYYRYAEVEINVDKKKLDFTVGESSFVYDGKEHFPAYSLPSDVENVLITGKPQTDAGKYTYILEVDDPNYFGDYTGSFEITKPTVTVTVSSAQMKYSDPIPEFTYTVEGFENFAILGIVIAKPERTSMVGEYEVGIYYENENVEYIVNSGTLTVIPADMDDTDVPAPSHSDVTYGDSLSDISFTGNYLGTWAWEDPSVVVDDINGITTYAIYTPDNVNYNPVRVEVKIIEVKKKELTVKVLKNEYTYTPGGSYLVIYQIENGEYTDLTVRGNDAVYAAGEYSRTLYIDDERYTGTVVTTLIVNKATPVTDFSTVYSKVWQEGLKLSDIALPDGYAWVNPNMIIGAGEHICEAIYTHEDKSYNTVSGKFTVKVAKAAPVFSGIEEDYDKTYDTLEYDIKNSGISVYHTDGILTITYYKDGVEVDKIINAGEYKVVISVTEGTNYLSATLERVVTVDPATNTQTVTDNQSATYGDPLSTLKLPEDLEGSWAWLETEIGDAGNRIFTAVYTPDKNGNYIAREVEISVTVKKKSISVPSISDKEYTGQEIDTGLADTDEYTVDGDVKATNVATYEVTFTLIDPDNYEWLGDEDEVSVTKSYKIVKALNSWKTEPTNVKSVYDGSFVYVSAEGNHGTVSVVYTLNGIKVDAPKGVGVYKAVVTVTDPNYDVLTKEVTVEITKQSVPVPVPTIGSFTYNGSEQGITVPESTLYSVDSEQKGTNAGAVIKLVLKLADSANYKWESTANATVELSATIAKATLKFNTDISVSDNLWTYTEAEGVITGATLDEASIALGAAAQTKFSTDNVNFNYSFEDLPRTGGKINAGKYYVKTVSSDSSNWDTISTAVVSFEVKKAKPDSITVTWKDTPTSTEGGKTVYYQNLLELSAYTVKFGSVAVDVTLGKWGPDDASFTFAGANTVYTFNVTPLDTTNFEAAAPTVSVPLKTVATVGFGGTAYGTIKAALDSAVSGDTVWVKADASGNVYITEDVTVKSGVTLLIPYGDAEDATGKNQDDAATLKMKNDDSNTPDVNESKYQVMANTLPEEYRKNWVKIAPGVTLTVTGTLEISGEMTGGGGGYMSGHTAGKYATLELCDGAKIVANGTIKCYGFIENYEGNDNGKLTLEKGSNIYVPFVLYDFKGGTILSAIYDDMSSYFTTPFHQFGFPNVSVALRMEHGASLTVMCSLYSNDQVNHTNASFIGDSTSHFIQLTDSEYSYLEAKYDPKTRITDLDIYGGAQMNEFKLTIKTTFGNVTVNSKDFVFGLSWLYDITLDNNEEKNQGEAIFTMPHRYKIMPGCKFTVEAGAKLTVGTLTVYDNTFVDRLGGAYPNTGLYPTVYPSNSSYSGIALASGKLTVRGTINATNLAGDVYTDIGGSVITVSGDRRITTYEPTIINKGMLKGSVDERQTVTRSLKLIYTDADGNVINALSAIIPGATYTSDASLNKWATDATVEYITITLPAGVHATIDSIVLTDADGNFADFGSYDSSAGGTVNVVAGTVVTFHLEASQLVVENGATTLTLGSAGDIKTSAYVYEWSASTTVPTIYSGVPVVNLSGYGVLSECTVTYKNLGSADCYVEIYMYKEVSTAKFWNKVTASFTATATKSTTTGTGSFTYTQYAKATVSTTVKVYEDDTVTVK